MNGEIPPQPSRLRPSVAAVSVAEPRRLARDVLFLARDWLLLCGLIFLVITGFHPFRSFYRIPKPTPNSVTREMAFFLADAMERRLTEESGVRFPSARPASGTGGDTDTDTALASGLITDLWGREPDVPERFPRAGANPEPPAVGKGGLFHEEGPPPRLAIHDAWGSPFRARLDTDGDGCVTHPDPEREEQGRSLLRRRVFVWSAGVDGDWDTWNDNVVSRG